MDDKTFALLDTVIKIGLGALIAGAVSLLSPVVMLTKEVLVDRRTRRLKALEAAIESFQQYHEFQLKYLVVLTNYQIDTLQEGAGTDERVSLDKLRNEELTFDASFNRATAQLELYGLHSATEYLRSYDEFLEKQKEAISLAKSADSVSEMYEKLRIEIRKRRRKAFEILGSSYNSEPELRQLVNPSGKVV